MCYDIPSIKQMTTKHQSAEGSVATISLPLVLVTLLHALKSQEIFALTGLCDIIMKVKAHKAQSGLM